MIAAYIYPLMTLNNFDDKFEFTFETEVVMRLPHLDVMVICKTISTDFYKKLITSNRILNFTVTIRAFRK